MSRRRRVSRGSRSPARPRLPTHRASPPAPGAGPSRAAAPRRLAGPLHPLVHAVLVVAAYAVFYTAFFWPVLADGDLLAPGDALDFHLPHLYSPVSLWTDLMFGGFPVAADVQVQTWYPLARIFALLPGSWNSYVIAAYVLASAFAYGYAWHRTRDVAAAATAGVLYGASGFLLAHVGHTTIVHGAPWLPLLIWSLDALRRGGRPAWIAAGALAVACGVTGGHPQILFYTLQTGGLYGLFLLFAARGERVRFALAAAGTVLLGLGLAAVQIAPTAELGAQGFRVRLSFEEFTSYSLPPRQLLTLVFPWLFGGTTYTPYRIPYFGEWRGPTELTGYAGLLVLPLALAALAARSRRTLAAFWVAIAVLALALAVGPWTPLARITYHLPGYAQFRAPARHLLELAMAASALSALGVAAIRRGEVSRRTVAWISAVPAAAVLVALLVVVGPLAPALRRQAASWRIPDLPLAPTENLATAVPLLVLAAVLGAVWLLAVRPRSRFAAAALVVVGVFDLGTFGCFSEWRYVAPPPSEIAPPDAARRYRARLAETHQRLLPANGALGERGELIPNLSRLWGLPSASGYSSLILARIGRLFPMEPSGRLMKGWDDPANRGLDVLAARYLVLSRAKLLVPNAIVPPLPAGAAPEPLLSIGPGCDPGGRAEAVVRLPPGIRANRLDFITTMGCSTALPQGAPAVSVTVESPDDAAYEGALRAGVETAEWAHACPDVQAVVRHAPAPVALEFPAGRPSACAGHLYAGRVDLPDARTVSAVRLRWVGGDQGDLGLYRMYVNDDARGDGFAIEPELLALSDSTRWRVAEDLGHDIYAYENLRARPRAWLVGDVVSVTADEALATVRTSRLPDGRSFDPARTAVIEEGLTLPASPDGSVGTAWVAEARGGRLDVRTSSRAPTLLVVSDVAYPGWQATVDGTPAPVVTTDYVLRGVPLPPGEHEVRMRFRPRSLMAGAAVSLVSAAALIVLAALPAVRRRYRTPAAPGASSS